MSTIDVTLRASGFAYAPRITRLIETGIERMIEYRERRSTRIILSQLSDRELDDIGLTRGDIYRRF